MRARRIVMRSSVSFGLREPLAPLVTTEAATSAWISRAWFEANPGGFLINFHDAFEITSGQPFLTTP